MASNLSTPASVLNAPVLTPVVLYATNGNNRQKRRELGKGIPSANVPARRMDLLKGEGKTLTRTLAKYLPAW